MAYRQVTRQELEEYIAKNPGAKYRVNGQEVQAPFQDEDKGVVMNLLTTLSKPLRTIAGGTYSAITGREKDNPFFTQREELDYAENPTLFGAKQAIGLGSYLLPVGAAEGATGLKAVGQAAKSGLLPGAMGGVAFSEQGKELSGALKGGVTGGLFAGTLQGVGEAAKALTRTAGSGKVVNTLDVDDIAHLPSKTKSGLVKQAKSAGFWDPKVSESKNIQNYLVNRGLAGNTPAKTLENMTQEFYRGQRLKESGLEEIGGLSKSYIDKIKGEIDDAVRYSGLGTDEAKVVKDMKAILDKAPRDAKTLDSIAQKWYDRGLTKAGDLKSSQAALYKYGAKTIRDNLKLANQGGSYSEGMRVLSQILGLQDEGLVAKTAARATDVGINVPLFSSAGFRGADIKLPFVSDIYSKTRAAIGRGQEMGGSGILGEGFSNILQNAAAVGQRAVPAVAGLRADTQEVGTQGVGTQPIYPTGTIPTTQGGQQGVGAQGISPLNLMLAQEVLNGNISAAEANAVLSLLGMEQDKTPQASAAQMDAQNAINMVNRLSQSIASTGLTGPIKGLGAKIPYATESKDLQAQIDLARQVVGKFLEGGVLRKEDEEKYKKILPTMYDTPEVAQRKLQNIMTELQSRLAQYEATGYSGYGQDPYAAIDELGL
jgi:hypothetical protein